MRTDEHINPTNETEPARHIRKNKGNHTFVWRVLLSSKHTMKRKILEAMLIAVHKPDLNKQMTSHPIFLFPMGIT